jgi:hypothetical protein
MPVRRFRSVEEMDRPAWFRPGDPALYRAIAVAWDFGRRANPRRFPPGVERFGGIEDMRRIQEQRDGAYVASVAARRRRSR